MPPPQSSTALVKRSPSQLLLEPIDAKSSTKNKKTFSKNDLVDAVRRLTASGSSGDVGRFDAANEGISTRRGSSSAATPLAMMEWGVNFNARKFNELRTAADKKSAELKKKLDSLRSLKVEQESLEKMCDINSPETTRMAETTKSIEEVGENIERRLHRRRQLEMMLARLQKNQVSITSHVNTLEDAYKSAVREYTDMRSMLRQVEAGHTKALLELAKGQRLAAVERDERSRALEQRKTEASQAAKMDVWRQNRELARLEFASELRGDLSAEEEEKLQQKLKDQRKSLMDLRAQHEVMQKEASSLESAFVAVRQATGVNSLDEVVEKFQSQEGNRESLTTEKKEAEERLANANRAKDDLEHRFKQLQNSGLGTTEMSREISVQLQGEIDACRIDLKASNATCERLESVLVALRQGAAGLFQRLAPFRHLLEGEGTLASAAVGGGAVPSASAPPGSATSDNAPAIDPIDAIQLCEIMLSKMVEVVGGGEDIHGPGSTVAPPPPMLALTRPGKNAADSAYSSDEALAKARLQRPENNNIRVPTVAQRLQNDATNALVAAGRDENTGLSAKYDADKTNSEDGAEQQQAMWLANASSAEEAFEDMVPNRSFLKLSSSRQHSEMIRRQEHEARRKRMMERIEMVEETDRAAMFSRAARKKAQAEATDRLSMLPSTVPQPTRVKDSAVEKSITLLSRTPHLV